MDLIDCFDRDDSEALRAYIEAGGDINISLQDLHPSGNGCRYIGSLVHHAVIRRAIKCLKVLLLHGANIEARDDDRCTPLMTACHYACTEEARLLLENGADPNAAGSRRFSVLHHVELGYRGSIADKVYLIKLLLDFGANRNIKDCFNHIPGTFSQEEEIIDVLSNYTPCIDIEKDPGTD